MKKHILATAVLLLVFAVSASAQNRSPTETLVGLREIAVKVEYAHADGVEVAMQPLILQRLQERAITRLQQAEIPLTDATDVTPGQPRLVFVVTANKQTDPAPAVIIQSKLYERVRLRRDPSREMELATWVQKGIGSPRATEKMLLDVLEGELTGFIKAYQQANPKQARAENASIIPAASLKEDTNSLQGLSGVKIFVAFRPDRLAEDVAHRAEFQKLLQKEAEAKLAQAGIPILKYGDEIEKAGNPLLYLLITLSSPAYMAPPISVQSNFWQQVRPVRDLKIDTYAVTWESELNDEDARISNDAIRRVFNSQLDEFIKAYTAVNPKPTTEKTVGAP